MIPKNVLLKKRLGCLLAAALLAGEIGSASMVAVAAPTQSTQSKTESQANESPESVDIPEEYITFGEPALTEPDVETEELGSAKAQADENIQTQIPVFKPDTAEETLDAAKMAETENETEEMPNVDFPETIPVLGGNNQSVEQESLAAAGEGISGVSENTVDELESEPGVVEPSSDPGVGEPGSESGSVNTGVGSESGATSQPSVSEQPSNGTASPMPSQPSTGGNVSDESISYNSIQVDDVISGEGHNGVFETKYFSFTPEESGYYGFEALTITNCMLNFEVQNSETGIQGDWGYNASAGACYSTYFEEGVTYHITINSFPGTEYFYETRFVSYEEIALAEAEKTTTVSKRAVLKINDKNTLYKIKIDSANDFDYQLYDNKGSAQFIALANGEENAFFYTGFGELCLKKDIDVEDEVTITLEKISATEYNFTNETQEIEIYQVKRNSYYSNDFYSLFSITADETGTYAIAVDNTTNIYIYSYNEGTQQLETTYINGINSYNGKVFTLEAGKTYYFLSYHTTGDDMVTVTAKKQDYIKQQIGTTVTYSGKNIIPLSFDTEAGKFYKILVEKTLEDSYYYSQTGATWNGASIYALKSAINYYGSMDGMSILFSKAGAFENSGDITVTIEECTIPEMEKDVLISNENVLCTNEIYITKFIPEETGVYELTGIRYDNAWAYGYIYEEVTSSDNVMGGLNQIQYLYFSDSSFNSQVSLEADKTYYMIASGNTQTEIEANDICFYITAPKNYQMNLSESEEETTSLDMELLKAANVSVTVPQSGFYELNIAGGEDLYQVSAAGVGGKLVLYKDQPKLAYFETPGTYTFTVSREFLPEDTLDELTFSIKKTSEIEGLSVYDGTAETEKEITLRESGDYTWLSFTPQEDGYYTFTENSYEEDYGYYNKYVYELKEDYLEYILYTNNMYELEAGKTYYIKVDTYNMEGANKHLILIKNPKTDLSLGTDVTANTCHGVVAKTTIEEAGIYKLTITPNKILKKLRVSANGSNYTINAKKDKAASVTMYLPKGEQTIYVRLNTVSLEETGLELKLEKEDVQENMQNITMDESTVWVKYVPTESEKSILGTKGAANDIDFSLYYQTEDTLEAEDVDYNYMNSDIYGIYDFKKDVTYYLKLTSYEVPNQFSMFINPIEQVTASTFDSNSVDVDMCTQISFDEEVINQYYELKISGNTSPLTTKLQFTSDNYGMNYVNSFDANGGSKLVEISSYAIEESNDKRFTLFLFNFSDEPVTANVEINKLEPQPKELTLNEKLTTTGQEVLETYTFTPEETGNYKIISEGLDVLKISSEDMSGWLGDESVQTLTAGVTYTFYVEEMEGKEYSIQIQKTRRLYLYDYEECSAFIASGGSITIMNEADVPQEVYDDYYDYGYSDIKNLNNGKVIVLRSDSFKDMENRWYPECLDWYNINDSYTTYGDIEQYIDKEYYYNKKYEGLYNENFKKVNMTDTMSNPYMAIVRYVPEYVAVQQIKLSGTTVMKVGETATLTAVLDTMNQYAPNDPTVTWTSSNNNVITVSDKGVLTAKGAGTATITVKSNDRLGKTASITIKVYQDVVYAEKVTISGSQSVNVGESMKLTATVTAKNNAEPTVKGVTWTTSDASVATVDENGNITGLKQGTVTITATSKDEKAKATYTVNVKNIVEQKISLNESKITMKKGTKYTWLDVTFKPENTTDKSLTWKSSNKKIVEVNNKGVLKAKGIGKATITVTSANGKTDKVNVSVTKYSIKVKKVSTISKQTMMEGETMTLPLEFDPVNATNQKVKWKSSNEDVATVNAKGVVTAKKAGKATITVTTQDGSKKSDKCVITVKELSKVTGVKVKSNKKKSVEITWNQVEDADGYVIYMATSKNGKYKKIATTKKDVTSYTKKKLSSKKKYYFKVSAIRKEGKKQYEGKFSDVKNTKVK